LLRFAQNHKKLSSMKGLVLPRLRELLLHENKISKIEGLDGCPRLQRLWLNCNAIREIEGLHIVGDLRELWLQNNFIVTVMGLDSLYHLREICLGGNQIDCFSDCNLRCLSVLPSIRSVSFEDVYHGPNPVCKQTGYRAFIMRQLKHITCIDGVQISENEQIKVEESYTRGIENFNESIEYIHTKAEREIAKIRSQKEKMKLSAQKIENQLLTHIKDLDNIVNSRTKHAECSIQKHMILRDESQLIFEKKVSAIVDLFTSDMDNLIQEQSRQAEKEERALHLTEAVAKAKEEHDLAILQSGEKKSREVQYQVLEDDAIDCQLIRSVFSDNQSTVDDHRMDKLVLLQCYRISPISSASFLTGSEIASHNVDTENVSRRICAPKPFVIGGNNDQHMYCCTSTKDMMTLHDTEGTLRGEKEIICFSDPLLAAGFYDKRQYDKSAVEHEYNGHTKQKPSFSCSSYAIPNSSKGSAETGESYPENVENSYKKKDDGVATPIDVFSYMLLQCTIALHHNERVLFGERPSFHEITQIIQNLPEKNNDVLISYLEKTTEGKINRQGHILYTKQSNINPDYHILACRVGKDKSGIVNTETQLRSAAEIIQSLEDDSENGFHDEMGENIGMTCIQQLKDELFIFLEAANQC